MTERERVRFLDLRAVVAAERAELDAALARVLDSGWFVLGAEVAGFERAFAQASGTAQCVGVASGLDALVLTLRGLGIGPGDEVVVPANTFIATWLAVTQVGATIVPVDVDETTGLIDAGTVAASLSDRTRCVVPVHLYGHVCDLTALGELVAGRDIALLEDAAQAHLARDADGRTVGGHGTAAAFSFYPGKNLGALGDGGAVTTSDVQLADRLRALRNYGSVRKYCHDVAGVNSRLDELHAAVLTARLPHLEAWNQRRRAIAARYGDVVDGTAARMPVPRTGTTPVWHLAPVWHPERDALAAHLDSAGIDTLVHYPVAPHRSGAYADAFAHASFPVAERISRETLSLPIGPHLSDAQVDRVCAALASFLSR